MSTILYFPMSQSTVLCKNFFSHEKAELNSILIYMSVEPRFNEVAGDRPDLFFKSRVRYIENLDVTNLRGKDQNIRYIEVIVND